MNALEKDYFNHLLLRKAAGEVVDFHFEKVILVLEDATKGKTTLTLDWWIHFADNTLEAHDTKGWMEPDAWIKLKWAASQFPWLKIVVVEKKKGTFTYKEV